MSFGITIVSHVYEVANGLPRLLTQVAKDIPITTAGGTEDNDVGTSMDNAHAYLKLQTAYHHPRK